MSYRAKQIHTDRDIRILELKKAFSILLEYLRYKQESDKQATLKSLGLYELHCYIQGQIYISDKKNQHKFDKTYKERTEETESEEGID